MSEKLKHPKSTKEKNLKIVTIQIVGRRFAIDADLKPISAWFLMEGVFEIEKTKNDKYRNFSFIRLFRAQKFSWDADFHMKTIVLLSDSFTTFILKPTEEMPNGVDFSITSPKRISEKEAMELKNLKGAYEVKLDAEDNIKTLAFTRF